MRRQLFVLAAVIAAVLAIFAAPAAAQTDAPTPLQMALDALIPHNVVSLDLGGSALDAQSSAVGYSRRVLLRESGRALYIGVSHPVGSLTGARLDGTLNLKGLDWRFSDVDRGLFAPHVRFQVHPLIALTAQFGGLCVVHADACDGYAYVRATVDIRLPTVWVPVTIRLGREGLVGDGELGGEWLRAISLGTSVGF